MKTNPSPSAPLNLCAPVGVTGTTLPASPVARPASFQMFYDHAGFSHDPKTETPEQGRERGAMALCAAESWAKSEHVSFEWAQDDQTNRSFTDEGEEYSLWSCVARDVSGNVIGSLGGVDFGCEGKPWGDPYRVIVEAEIALEAMPSPASPVKDTPAFAVDSLSNPPYTTGEHKGLSVVDFDAPASPVDSVGVPDMDVYQAFERLIFDAKAMDVRLLAGHPDPGCEKGSIVRARVALAENTRSHAAKDARIADLEQALKTVLDLARDTPTDALVRFAYIRSRCRAALALPCAPLGS